MNINSECPLVLSNLWFYDFRNCFSTILKNMGWDFDGVDLSNKEERNIYLGKLQKGNYSLQQFIDKTVKSLLDFYISRNEISESDIIVLQRDGFILTKPLANNDTVMKLELRELIDTMILSYTRKHFIYKTRDKKISVKGVSNTYEQLQHFYSELFNFNFYNKSMLFSQMESFKNSVLNCQSKRFFMVPVDEGKYAIQTMNGPVTVNTEVTFSISDINSKKYYEHYYEPFLKSLYLQFYK